MKGLIVYKTKYGTSEQFAKWLSDETNFEFMNYEKNFNKRKDFNLLIIISSVHGGKLNFSKWIIKNWKSIENKKIILLVVSGAEKEEVEFLNHIVSKNFPQVIKEKLKIFYIGGRYKFSEMSFFDAALIKTVAFFIKDPDTKQGMLKQTDDVKKENIIPVVDYINNL